MSAATGGSTTKCTISVLQRSLSLSYDVAPGARRRASATHLRGCRARCRCCSDARRLGTGRLVQHLWRDYPVLINRRPGETRKTRRVSGFAPPENIRDVTFSEDTATSRTGSGPANLATIRAAIIAAIKDAGYLHIPEGRRDHTTPAEALHLHGLDQDRNRHSRNTPEPWPSGPMQPDDRERYGDLWRTGRYQEMGYQWHLQ